MPEDSGRLDTTTKLARQQKHASHVIANVPARDPQVPHLPLESFQIFCLLHPSLRLASPKRNIQSREFYTYHGIVNISEEEEIYVSLPINSWSCRTHSSYSFESRTWCRYVTTFSNVLQSDPFITDNTGFG